MIIIVDSGSTKTNWVGVNNGVVEFQIATQGVNPFFIGESEFEQILQDIDGAFSGKPDRVLFFGAGISNHDTQTELLERMSILWDKAEILIQNDLVGAAIGALGDQSGTVCILGTGMNSGYWNGVGFDFQVPSTGFILGDEGSGADLGKYFLSDYLTKNMPKEVVEMVNDQFPEEKKQIIQRVYGEGKPNRYLASFVPFIHTQKSNTYFSELIFSRFTKLYDRCLSQYDPELPFSFVGSVAYYFQDELKVVLESKGIKTHSFLQDPMPGLIAYYK